MIPMILMAIEDDADRAFMINLYEQCHKAMYRQAYDNRARQGSITQELTEIVAGAEE